jgi:hypothetical protein
MDTRQQKGLKIAFDGGLKQNRLGWQVPSQSNNGSYVVNIQDGFFCTCPDFETRGLRCKHIHAVEFTVQRVTAVDGTVTETKTVKVTCGWSAYNAAQTNEKDHFQALLRGLCRDLAWSGKPRRGRPRLPLGDAIFSAVFKVYSTVSGRRFMSDLRAAKANGHISRVPCYNSIFNVFSNPQTAGILSRLIEESAIPLRSVETSFACDSSGFSTSRFDRWFDHKHGRDRFKRAWVKAHLMCGVTTNVVTALEIRGRNANDAPLLPVLLSTTARNFDISEVSADLGYSSASNLQEISDVGARPLIPFKHNASPARGGI